MTHPATDRARVTPSSRRRPAAVLRFLDALDDGIAWLLGPDAAWSRRNPARRTAIGWIVTRALVIGLYLWLERRVGLDVSYYFEHLTQGGGLAETLREYPVGAVAVVGLPLLVVSTFDAYHFCFVVLMLLVDALFTTVLFRRDRAGYGVGLWLAAGPAVGALLITRFDVVPGAAAAVAVLVLARHPRVAALLVAAAALVKLWPVLLIPAVAAPRRTRRPVLVTFVVALVVVGVGALALGGLDRNLAPLDYQARRGLQIESLPAWPLMVAWSVWHAPWTVAFSEFICSQVYGPGENVMLALASLGTLVTLLVAGALGVRSWRLGSTIAAPAVAWAALGVAGLVVSTNKVFSPQYMLWLLPLACVVVVLDGGRTARRSAVALLVAALLGQLLYPAIYPWVSEPDTWNSLAVPVLAIRLVPVVAVTVVALRRAWRDTAPTVDLRVDDAVLTD